MNFDKLYAWALGIVIAFAAAGQLDTLQAWIWRAQAHVLYESRTATWGSPRFFPTPMEVQRSSHTKRTR
jgi:hypothetical protein